LTHKTEDLANELAHSGLWLACLS